MKYYPDSYSIILDASDNDISVFAGWYGNFVSGDSWKLSSGTIKIQEVSPVRKGTAYKKSEGYEFLQHSGSSYILSKEPWSHTVWVEYVLCKLLGDNPSFKVIVIEEAIKILKEK